MRYKFTLGTIVQANQVGKPETPPLQWRVIEIVGNCSGVRYLCERINYIENNSKRIIQDFKESDLQVAEIPHSNIKSV